MLLVGREAASRRTRVVVKRRRYDTVELVAEIRRERRNGIILALAGIGILVVLLGLYISGLGDEKVPTAPGAEGESATGAPAATPATGEPTVAGTGSETAAPDLGAAAGETDASKAAEPTASEPEEPAAVATTKATLQIVVTRKSTLWIDGEKIGKVKKHVVELEPGEHEIKAKLGKKLVTQKLAPKAGATYLLRFDAKRKKAVLKKK